ncbi:MAG: hypothetical protein HOD17_08950 [Desulfobacteraceae bacterium]|nr:hypothetical protein [Desulfobacteraceae bacterium]
MTEAWNKKLGARYWLGITLPEEIGGLGKSHFDQVVFEEAFHANGHAPTWIEKSIMVDWVTPTIFHFGTKEQKKNTPFLPLKLK